MARWSGPSKMADMPDELKEDETTGALRLVLNKAARKHAGHDVGAEETACSRNQGRLRCLRRADAAQQALCCLSDHSARRFLAMQHHSALFCELALLADSLCCRPCDVE